MMSLQLISENAQQAARAIKKVVDVDVVIVDDKCARIADTFEYGNEATTIRPNSIIGMIVRTGKPLAIDDKDRFATCRECVDREKCRMSSLIGVPILFEDSVAGAIGLVIPAHSFKRLFDNLPATMDFLDSMGEMLSGKMKTMRDIERLQIVKRQNEVILDNLPDAVALLDEQGLITYANPEFNRVFFESKQTINVPVHTVLGHQKILTSLQNNESFFDLPIHYKYRKSSFDGMCSMNCFNIDGLASGAIIAVKQSAKQEPALSDGKTADELVLSQMRHYLAQGIQKTQIAGILGISRATLYRMINRTKGKTHD